MVDYDGDGFRAGPCGNDCNDTNPAVHPYQYEICGNGIDDDCNGLIDCQDPMCSYYPDCGEENICDNGVDDDGDGLVDCADPDCCFTTSCPPVDEDGDGYYDMPCGRDCDDTDPNAYPGTQDTFTYWGVAGGQATEICDNGVDDDCNGLIDLADPYCGRTPCYDWDHDGYDICDPERDCDDTNPLIHPGAAEICGNHRDDDCDGVVDEGSTIDQEIGPETSYEWSGSETNARNVHTGNVDGDHVTEIVTVGWVTASTTQGQLKIGTWNGSNGTEEKTELFNINGMETKAIAVDVGELDNHGPPEIVVTGYAWDAEGNYYGWIQVYHWDGTTLSVVTTTVWAGSNAASYSVKVGDPNNDDTNEIVTCGATWDGTRRSQLQVWGWGPRLDLLASEEWAQGDGEYSECNAVALGELDGEVKIATVGDFKNDSKYWGELRVWSYDSDLTLESSEEWESAGDTLVSGVFIADNKIFTAGLSNDGTRENGQLRVWNWGSLSLDQSVEWYTDGDTRAFDVFVANCRGDCVRDVVTVGYAYDNTRQRAQLRVWNYASALTLADSEEWYKVDDTDLFSLYIDDVDRDGVNEIITAGYANMTQLAQVTIWSYKPKEAPHHLPAAVYLASH